MSEMLYCSDWITSKNNRFSIKPARQIDKIIFKNFGLLKGASLLCLFVKKRSKKSKVPDEERFKDHGIFQRKRIADTNM